MSADSFTTKRKASLKRVFLREHAGRIFLMIGFAPTVEQQKKLLS